MDVDVGTALWGLAALTGLAFITSAREKHNDPYGLAQYRVRNATAAERGAQNDTNLVRGDQADKERHILNSKLSAKYEAASLNRQSKLGQRHNV